MQKKQIMPLFAAIAGLVLAVGTTAFTDANRHKSGTTYFKFNGNSLEYNVAAKWESNATGFANCAGSTIVCTAESSSITNVNDLMTYFSTNSPTQNNIPTYQVDSHKP